MLSVWDVAQQPLLVKCDNIFYTMTSRSCQQQQARVMKVIKVTDALHITVYGLAFVI